MGKGRMPGMPGGMPGGNMNNMIKQAQKMQKQMQEAQEALEKKELEITAGGGAISIKINGKKEIMEMKIKPEVVDSDDVEMLEDLILAAVNEAIRKVDEMAANEMGKVTGGMNMPGLF